jgi:hypothetical protein
VAHAFASGLLAASPVSELFMTSIRSLAVFFILAAAPVALAQSPLAEAQKVVLPPPIDAVCGYEVERFCHPGMDEGKLVKCLSEREADLGRTCKAALAEIRKDLAPTPASRPAE